MAASQKSITGSSSSDPEPFFPNPPAQHSENTSQSYQDPDTTSTSNPKKRKSSSSAPKPKQRPVSAKAHVCPTCFSTFSRLFNLNQHVLIHTNNREFNCLEEGCTKVFLRSTDLTRHCKHVHRVDTKKDKRYSIQKKKLSDKPKPPTTATTSSYPQPPLSPSFSSASSENTTSTQASSYSTYSASAPDRSNQASSSKLAPEPTFASQRNTHSGEQSDNEPLESDARDDYPERIRPTFEAKRSVDRQESDSLSLPPIKTSFLSYSQPQFSSAASHYPIVLPPLHPTHSPHITSSSQGSTHSLPSILNGPSSAYSGPCLLTRGDNHRPLTPTLPSIRSQLPFSFSQPLLSPNSNALSNLRTQAFDRRSPLPPMKTSPSML